MPVPRLLFVEHTGALGGAELSLLDIAEAHRESGTVALLEDGPFRDALERRGVTVRVIEAGASLRGVKKGSGLPGVSVLLAFGRAALRLRSAAHQRDVLYANSPKSMLVSVMASIATRRRVVWHLRDILGREHFSQMNIGLLTRIANRRVARVIANSQATADAFIASGGHATLVRVVHNGLDAAPFDAVPPAAREAIRTGLGISASAFVIGSFSRLHPWKGQHVLLDAMALLPDAHAIVVGGALFSGEAAYAAALSDRASRAPLSGRVHMLGARADVPELMSACDVIVHTSVLPEPFGRVLVEAMLARRPLVASDAGGVREVVRRDRTGLLVAPGDAAALAQAVTGLRDDPARSHAMVEAAAADARTRFTREAMLAGVNAVLAELEEEPR